MPCKKKRLASSLTSRLIFTYVAGLMVLGIAVYCYLFLYNPNFLINYLMNKQFSHISENVYKDAEGNLAFTPSGEEKIWIYQALSEDVIFQILTPSSQVAMHPFGNNEFKLSLNQSQIPATGRKEFDLHNGNMQMRVLAGHLSPPLQDYTLEVALSERILEVLQISRIKPLSRVVLTVIVMSIILSSLIAYFTIRRMVKPLRDLSLQSAAISPNNLQQRLFHDEIPTEMISLVTAFNGTLDRLEKGFKIQQEFLATAAHELKTPLALIRGEVEMSGSMENRDLVLQDIDHLTRQIHQILHFAEVRELQNYQFEWIDTKTTVLEVIAFLSRLAEKKNIEIRLVSDQQKCNIMADASMLFTLAKNLLENAIIHSPEDGLIEIVLTQDKLMVRDYGKGLTEDNIPLLFKKFWRGNSRQTQGAGLGLSICHEIATAHNWKIIPKNANPGALFILLFNGSLEKENKLL